jgi:hypothetical protein
LAIRSIGIIIKNMILVFTEIHGNGQVGSQVQKMFNDLIIKKS